MIALIISLGALSLILIFHELGHFYFARRAGVKVEELGIGLPPAIWKKKKGKIVYSINAIPFGAFVKMDEGDKFNPQPATFAGQSLKTKLLILSGGVLANFLIAFIILILLFARGIPVMFLPTGYSPSITHNLTIAELEPHSSVIHELQKGDIILNIKAGTKNYPHPDIVLLQNVLQKVKTQSLLLTIKRGASIQKVNVQAHLNKKTDRYILGIGLQDKGLAYYSWWQAPGQALRYMVVSLRQLKTVFTHWRDVSGPIGVAVIAVKGFEFGWRYWLFIMAIISYNLFIFNLLPFPALDGGRMLFLIIEKIRNKPIATKIENQVNNIGFSLLIIMLLLVSLKDIKVFIFKK